MLTFRDLSRRYQVPSDTIWSWVDAGFLPEPEAYGDQLGWPDHVVDQHDRAVWSHGAKPDRDPPKQKRSAPCARARLEAIAAIVSANDADLGAWFGDALQAITDGTDPAVAFELNATAARVRRDAAIRYAAELIKGTDWQKAAQLAKWAAYLADQGSRPENDTRARRMLADLKDNGIDLCERDGRLVADSDDAFIRSYVDRNQDELRGAMQSADGIEARLQKAATHHPLPTNQRQFYRVLTDTDSTE